MSDANHQLLELQRRDCFGTPIRDPEGEAGTPNGRDILPLSISNTIFVAESVIVNGERPLICPHLGERNECNAWVGVVKNPNDSSGIGRRYASSEVPRCYRSYRIPNSTPTT